MAATTNRIGAFFFISLVGQPQPLRLYVAAVARSGVNGTSLHYDGVRGEPFVLRSKVDTADKTAARNLFMQYNSIVGGPAVPLIWSGLQMLNESYKVSVLRVEPVVIEDLIGSTGGLNPPSLGWLECDWHLIAVSL